MVECHLIKTIEVFSFSLFDSNLKECRCKLITYNLFSHVKGGEWKKEKGDATLFLVVILRWSGAMNRRRGLGDYGPTFGHVALITCFFGIRYSEDS